MLERFPYTYLSAHDFLSTTFHWLWRVLVSSGDYYNTSFCQVPGKLNIRIRTNKGQLAGHDLGHIDQATAAVTLHEAGADYKNCSSALLPAETLQACDRTCVRLQRA